VVDARCRYKSPARYDEEITVRTRLRGIRGKLVHFGYEVVRAADATLLAEGETTHIVTDRNMKPRALPGKYAHVLAGHLTKEGAAANP
jgi:acyl-CoA thioester hydrolase